MRVGNEKNISTVKQKTRQRSRISPAHEDQAGPSSPEAASGQGPQAAYRSSRHQIAVSGSDAPVRTHGQTWPRGCRLNRDDEFRLALRHGKSYFGGWFRLRFWPDPIGEARFAISVRRSVGNACARNRARRQLRESLRVARPRWPRRGWGVVIIDRPTPARLSGAERQRTVEQLLDRTRLLVERLDS